jgi:Na+/H+ antiporter NhaD/arsenite permease-like protein
VPCPRWRIGLKALAKDPLLLVLIGLLPVLLMLAPAQIGHLPTLVDWPTIAALAGLLMLTKGIELSGALGQLGHWLVGSMATERAAALSLVSTAALLSTVLTNDVALFIVVPLTLHVCRIAGVPATRWVVFEALAVNTGSALTAVGNPQNLFLWQRAQVSMAQFSQHMLPLVLVLMALLLALTALAFQATPMQRDAEAPEPLNRSLLAGSLALYLPFLVLTDLHQAPWAALAVGLLYLVGHRQVWRELDWGLLLVFVLMFIDLRLIAGLDVVKAGVAALDLAQPLHLYAAGMAASQVVSNVPATIALAEYSANWKVLSYAVNIGGFGLALGSMANLIALRLLGERRAWLSFHAWALPSLVVAAGVGYGLLF